MADINSAFGRNAAIVAEAGVTLEEYNALTATLTMTGMKAANAQNGISQAVTALIKPSTELSRVYKSLGYQGPTAFKDIVIASGGLVSAMEKIDKQGARMGISFGQDFREKRAMLVDLLATGTLNASFREKLKTQFDGLDPLTDKFIEQTKTAAAQMQLFQNSVNRLGISVGNLLLPALTKISNTLEPVIDGVANFAKNHKVLMGGLVKGVAYFGLFAASVASVSLVVGAVTKSFALLNVGITAFNFLSGFAAVRMNTINTTLLETPAYAKGAEFAMNGYAAAIIKTGAAALVLYYALKGINHLENKRLDIKDYVNKNLPKDLKAKYGVVAGFDNGEIEYNRHDGSGVRVTNNADTSDKNRIQRLYDSYGSYDSARDARNEFLEKRNDSLLNASQDSLYKQAIQQDSVNIANDTAVKATSYVAPQAGQSSKMEYTFNLKVDKGVSVEQVTTGGNGNRAGRVKINIIPT